MLYPPTIYCAGANYTDHVANMAKIQNIPLDPDPHELGLHPWHFVKVSRCAVATGDAVELPSAKLDWEAELGPVIGTKMKNVPLAKALEHVAFYTIGNDLSARDLTARPHIAFQSPFKYDWIGQKVFDGACPMGPWLVPAAEIGDPQKLSIKLWVNGVLKQDSNTSRMIFTAAEQIAHLSSRITLYPGDVVLTGTPSGVGAERGEFLRHGDTDQDHDREDRRSGDQDRLKRMPSSFGLAASDRATTLSLSDRGAAATPNDRRRAAADFFKPRCSAGPTSAGSRTFSP